MKKITVEYYPFRKINIAIPASGNIPTCWNDVMPEQLIAVMKMVETNIAGPNFIHTLTGFSKYIIRKLGDFQRFQLMESMTFLSDDKLHNSIIHQKLFAGKQYFKAPKPKLKGMTFGQFIFIQSHFGSYQHNQDKQELSNFLAALYNPSGKKFEEEQIPRYAPIMEKTNPLLKEAIVLNFSLIMEWLSAVYPLVFVKPPVDANKNETPKEYDPMVWPKIFENMVGDDIRNSDDYAKLPIHTALRFISKRIKMNSKIKK